MEENYIEWITGSDYIGATLSQKKWINRVETLAKQDENVRILARNNDGSIFCHLPASYLKLSKKRPVQFTSEKKEELVKRLREGRR